MAKRSLLTTEFLSAAMRALGMIRFAAGAAIGLAAIAAAAADPGVRSEWSPEFVEQAVTEARNHGDARRGAGVFADDRVPAAF